MCQLNVVGETCTDVFGSGNALMGIAQSTKVWLAEPANEPRVFSSNGYSDAGSARIDWRFLMLSWALTFFVVAIIAAVLGFSTIAGAAAGIAKILFFIFLLLTLVALVGGALRGRPPV
jgi:uncharacterized membrane protein YtjA (UPF0391 family)